MMNGQVDLMLTPERYMVKSPLNYVGGKFRLLPQLMCPKHDQDNRAALMPDDIETFVDVFCGGFNVGANAPAQRVVAIDADADVIDLLAWMRDTPTEQAIADVKRIAAEYGVGLSPRLDRGTGPVRPLHGLEPLFGNEALPESGDAASGKITMDEFEHAYYALREAYNTARCAGERRLGGNDIRAVLYTLVAHGFNSHIRFSRSGGYNIPYGFRTFNKRMAIHFAEFSQRLRAIKPTFMVNGFAATESLALGPGDYVYVDPPYSLGEAAYNESTGWSMEDDVLVFSMLDRLHARGVRFGLSNVIEHKGERNALLAGWAKRYRLIDLDYDYSNASYHRKDTGGNVTREVFVTNV